MGCAFLSRNNKLEDCHVISDNSVPCHSFHHRGMWAVGRRVSDAGCDGGRVAGGADSSRTAGATRRAGYPVSRARRVRRVNRASKGTRASRASKASRAKQACKVNRAIKVSKASKARREPPVLEGSVGPQGERGPSMTDELTKRVLATARESVVKVNTRHSGGTGWGTGVYIDSNGSVLTANHVVNKPSLSEITVTDINGDVEFYEVGRSFAGKDLVLLVPRDVSVTSSPAPVADSGDVLLGTPVVLLGDKDLYNPDDQPIAQFAIVAGGYPYNCRHCGTGSPFHHVIDVSGGSGSSGSPVLTMKGELIGILIGSVPTPAFALVLDLTGESF